MTYFLHRDGENIGPLTQEQIDEMRLNGELFNCQWIWKEGSPSWEPIPRMPMLPKKLPGATESADMGPAAKELGPAVLSAIVFATGAPPRSGHAQGISDKGCIFRMRGSRDEAHLPFPQKSTLSLDLLDPDGRRSECVSVKVESLERQANGDWEVQLSWVSKPPALGQDPA